MNLIATNVPGYNGINAKLLGAALAVSYMGVSSGPPKGTRIIHHGADELLIQRNNIPNGETAPPIQEKSQRSQSLCRFFLT